MAGLHFSAALSRAAKPKKDWLAPRRQVAKEESRQKAQKAQGTYPHRKEGKGLWRKGKKSDPRITSRQDAKAPRKL